jgi:hypothetical protein
MVPESLTVLVPEGLALLPSKRTVPVSVPVAPSKIPVPPTTTSVRLPLPISSGPGRDQAREPHEGVRLFASSPHEKG